MLLILVDHATNNNQTIHSNDEDEKSDCEKVEDGAGLDFDFEESCDERNFENGKTATAVEHGRKDVKTCKSLKKLEQLQGYVKREFGHELKLIFEVRTRWNSVFDLCERYIKLRSCVFKAYVDVNMVSNVTSGDMKTLKDFCSCLKPLKL